MKKVKLVIMIVLLSIIGLTIIDIISIYTRSKPIFAIKGSKPYSYYGLFYNTYNCPDTSMAKIKYKWNDYNCEGIKEEVDNSRYYEYEQKVLEAANKYYKEHYGLTKINVDDLLKEQYLEPLKDGEEGTLCTGYARLEPTDAGILGKAYIKCKNYMTEGYGNDNIDVVTGEENVKEIIY